MSTYRGTRTQSLACSRVHACFPRVEPNLNKRTDTLRIYRLIGFLGLAVRVGGSFLQNTCNSTPAASASKSRSISIINGER